MKTLANRTHRLTVPSPRLYCPSDVPDGFPATSFSIHWTMPLKWGLAEAVHLSFYFTSGLLLFLFKRFNERKTIMKQSVRGWPRQLVAWVA
jgi:hypothetical protein